MVKRYRKGGKRKSRKYGSQPSSSTLSKECSKLYKNKTCPFEFYIVPIVHKSKSPLTVAEQRQKVKDALLRGAYYVSVGHVPLKSWTLIFFVRRSPEGKLALPELRLMSKRDLFNNRIQWVHVRE